MAKGPVKAKKAKAETKVKNLAYGWRWRTSLKGDKLTAYKEKEAARYQKVRFRVPFPSPRAPRFRSFAPHAPP
jgi:hypothetical protein